MTEWRSDDEIFDVMKKELFTAVVGDVMDRAGLKHQFLPPSIKPLHPSMIVLGRAMPALAADVFEERAASSQNSLMAVPFGLMFQALDSLQPNEVYVCTGASPNYALWGGLMSTRARQLGATGAVLNGYSRDTAEILRLRFPTCSLGGYAQDQGPRGKVIDFRVSVEVGLVRINPGDIVYGDLDGVCVIPREAEADIVQAALEKVRGENLVRKALESGMSAFEAFQTFGIM